MSGLLRQWWSGWCAICQFPKAFDVVDHSILIKKISMYKIDKVSLKWFISHLNNRHQVIDSDQGLSEFMRVKFGVSQGPILGPKLFLFFINDLPLFLKYCYSDLYADNATFHSSNTCMETIENDLQNDAGTSLVWRRQNKIFVNFDKTSFMVLGTK